MIHSNARGVSPVVGVILMVAITVILAAVIGTFVLDLGSSTSSPVQAGVTYAESPNTDGTYDISLTFATNSNADSLEARLSSEDWNYGASSVSGSPPDFSSSSVAPLNAIGDELVASDLPAGETVTVIGLRGDQQTVLNTYTVGA